MLRVFLENALNALKFLFALLFRFIAISRIPKIKFHNS